MFLYKRNTWFILINLALFFIDPLSSEHQYSKFWQSYFNGVFSMPMNICWLNFPPQPNINIETTLSHEHWIDVILSMLFCQRWNNVDKHTSAQLSFSTKFQRWNNFGSLTLNQRNSFNVVSTLSCQRWNNVDKSTSAQPSFSTKYQRWNIFDERWRSTLLQRWFKFDLFAGLISKKDFIEIMKTCTNITMW